MQYSLLKKKRIEYMSYQMERAEQHHAHRLMKVHLDEWKVKLIFQRRFCILLRASKVIIILS